MARIDVFQTFRLYMVVFSAGSEKMDIDHAFYTFLLFFCILK